MAKPSKEQLKRWAENHIRLWNAGDKKGFLENLRSVAPGEVRMQDPRGTEWKDGWEEQSKAFEQFRERFERLEASLSLSLDHISKVPDTMPPKIAEQRPGKAESSKSSKVSKKTSKKHYHTVNVGETLYGISRKYGLTVKNIQLMNKLNDRFVIYPGQKLLLTI